MPIILQHRNDTLLLDNTVFKFILLDLFLVGICSTGSATLLTTKKAKLNNEKIWDSLTKILLASFIVPLAAGGIYMLIILKEQRYGQTSALILLFYGLDLLNASK
ncbi:MULTISPECIES: hypothetical protein [unclassified Polaribacter]|uniref:hypothetical protein n=1 Tax=unclassified Polaribacter TaxID=196858 RepID=UPI002939202B|nr:MULTISPECIES: hypothetical protein [unclassified Polaribacter]